MAHASDVLTIFMVAMRDAMPRWRWGRCTATG